MVAFNKHFAPLDSVEAAQDALKQINKAKAPWQSTKPNSTSSPQTGWPDADHCTRSYDGLSEAIKDNLAISDCPIGTLVELRQATQILDQ